MKFNHLNVPTHWQNYWTRYPEGHTILEALISWVSQVDSMVDNQNKLNDNVAQFRNEIDAFVERFDDRLQDEVTQTLNEWQTSGFLDVVISEALQWQLDNYITTNEQDKLSLTTQLTETMTKVEDNTISPDDFPGVSDAIKVQAAIGFALENDRFIRLSRYYDLTGATLEIVKPVNSKKLSFIGAGGGFIKNDDGFMFSADETRRTNQFIGFNSVYFKGDNTKDTIIADGDKLIGLIFLDCQFQTIQVAKADIYMQSLRVIACVENGLPVDKYLFDFNRVYDVDISHNQFENALGGVYRSKSTETSDTFDNIKVRITNNVIEGRQTIPIVVGSIQGLEITGNYFEANKFCDIKYEAGGHLSPPQGLVIDNNNFFDGGLNKAVAVDLSTIPPTGSERLISFKSNTGTYSTLLTLSSSAMADTTGSFTTGSVKPGPGTAYNLADIVSEYRKYLNVIKNEFLTVDENPAWASTTFMAGALVRREVEDRHPGVAVIRSSTTADSGAEFKTDPIPIATGQDTNAVLKVVKTSLTNVKFGFFNDNKDTTNGVFFELENNYFRGKVVNDGVENLTTTVYTPVLNTWYRLHIEITGSSTVNFKVYADNSLSVLWSNSLNVGIPTSGGHGFSAYSSGVVAQDLVYLDYIDIYNPNPMRRFRS